MWLVLAASGAPALAATPTISAQQYASQLRETRAKLEQLEPKPTRDVRLILKALESDRIVKRGDGKTLLASGDEWAKRLAVPRDGTNNANLTRAQLLELQRAIERHRRAFIVWNTPRNGAYFQSSDAQAIISQVEKSGQIRVAPHPWQIFTADVWQRVGDAWSAFWKWIGSLMPTPRATTATPPIYRG
jgi:hypothetical protein